MSNADTRAPGDTDAATAALRLEAEQLRRQTQTDRRVLDKLQNVPQSGTASQTSQALHQRYQQALERRSDLLETLLQTAEVHGGELQEENHTLRTAVDRLSYKLKCAHYELKKALGVKASTAEETSGDGDAPVDKNQEREAGRQRKRGAPKGHRGVAARSPTESASLKRSRLPKPVAVEAITLIQSTRSTRSTSRTFRR
ncbi:MAG: hypothetical protein GY906_26790 [bacterium]|nr:hypothetical protein [bacterium]